MKKKHSKIEEGKDADKDEVVDNKNVNSHEENNLTDRSAGSGSETEQGSDEGPEAEKEAGEEPLTDKEGDKEAAAEAKVAELQDRYLRLSAEFDNYRKRTLREKIELTKHAGEAILVNIIPVMDDFERALKVMESATDCAAMKTGIDLIYGKFRDFLTQNGIKEIEALNNDFNVDLHDAVSKMPAADESQIGRVIEVVQKGYFLHDKVMRHSKVIVGG